MVAMAITLVACSHDADSVLVMSNSEVGWMKSSNTMGQDMASAAKITSSNVQPVTNDNFSDVWNNSTSSCAIIHTHGGPAGFYGTDLTFTTSDLDELNTNKNMKLLLITACEVGGVNGTQTNMGQLISEKIAPDGIVICSTTVVSGGNKYFTTTNGGTWVVYQNGVQIDATLPTTITMKDAVDLWRHLSS